MHEFIFYKINYLAMDIIKCYLLCVIDENLFNNLLYLCITNTYLYLCKMNHDKLN